MRLDEKLAVMRRPGTYPEDTAAVEAIETHMSWVFLTDRHAYKLKKPVRTAFLDFASLEARRADCEREVVLNRRLAPRVYLGVTALRRRPDGTSAVGPTGEPLEWLVVMRRLPADRMLDALIARRAVDPAALERAARLLTRFYRRAEPLELGPEDYLARFAHGLRDNRAVLAEAAFGLDGVRLDRVTGAQARFLDRHGDLLRRRARDRRIVEGHGDLRPQHVVLTAQPVVIDCLEFNRRLRELDPLDELAYLALECERLGDAAVGRRVLGLYARETGDAGTPALLAFYAGFRACVRAKLAAWHTSDDAVRDHPAWLRRADDYLTLAERRAGAMSAA